MKTPSSFPAPIAAQNIKCNRTDWMKAVTERYSTSGVGSFFHEQVVEDEHALEPYHDPHKNRD